MTKRMGRFLIFIMAISIIFTSIFADTGTTQNKVNVVGNTIGNMRNRGYYAQQGEWIYFHNKYDNFSLYKMKLDSSNITKLDDGLCGHINVVGDWIYYTDGEDEGRIYKIRTDGTKKTKLSSDKYVGQMMVIGEWIYYNDDSPMNGIRKIKTDGTQKKFITKKGSYDFNIVGDTIYFNEGLSLYKSKLDGTKKVKLYNDFFPSVLHVEGDWIYYITMASSGPDRFQLCKMKTDGTKRTKIGAIKTDDINIADGWIYYNNISDNGRLYKVKTDGSSNTKMDTDVNVADICIIGNTIFYLDNSKPMRINVDNTDRRRADGIMIGLPSNSTGEEIQGVVNTEGNSIGNINNFTKVAKQGDWVYFLLYSYSTTLCREKVDGSSRSYLGYAYGDMLNVVGDSIYYRSNGIYKTSLDGSSTTKLEDGYIDVMLVSGDWIYYVDIDDKIFRMKTDGTNKTKLTDCRTSGLNLVGDSIYYLNRDTSYQSLYKMNLDGSNNVMVSSYTFPNMIIAGDNIFYINSYKEDLGKLYKSTLDGKTRKKICDDKVYRINIDDNAVYYINESDKNSLYSIATDGSGRKKLVTGEIQSFSIIGDWIYYDKAEDAKMYKVKKDGTQTTIVKLEYIK